ncbi:MAG TPA: FecR domain-containing protein [Gammaproteobacteria bacterium]|nr:FecR domain-containing protein [Gammaproteobacteria bacterium]
MRTGFGKSFILSFLAACVLCFAVQAAEPVGQAEVVNGTVTAILGTETRTLSKGDPVYEGDQLATGDDGALVVIFRDETKFVLWHNTRMNVEHFADKQGEEGLSTRIIKGAFRFVSGLVAKRKPSAMQVKLAATATIGIRGTHVAGELEGESASVVLMEPEGEPKATAITVFNDYGSVDITEPGFGTNVPDAHSPPSPVQRMRLRNIENLMHIMQSIQRTNLPHPAPRPQIR